MKNPGKTYCIIEILTVTAYHLVLHSGGPDGEMGASMRYLSQRFTAPNRIVAGVLNDVGRTLSKLRIKNLSFFE